MNRSRIVFFTVSLLLVLPLLAGSLSARDAKGDEDSLFKHLAVFTEVLGLVHQAYVEPSKDDVLMGGALDGATDALDPFSVYVPAEGIEAYKAVLELGSRLSGLTLVRDRGFIYLIGVAKGSPAEAAGLEVADMVAEVDGESTRFMPLWKVQSRLVQAAGTVVVLKVYRNQDVFEKTLTLASFEPPPLELGEQQGTAIWRFHSLGKREVAAVEQALAAAGEAKRERLLLDLRGVSGGDVDAAYELAALFADGELGVLKHRDEALTTFRGATPRWQGRIVLLVDRATLGAAEVFSTVLRQKLKAELVGERTFGYAGRRSAIELSGGGALWLTDAFYTGPDGEPVRGSLMPDVAVSARSRTVGEADADFEDLVLERGLARLLEPPAPPVEEKAAA